MGGMTFIKIHSEKEHALNEDSEIMPEKTRLYWDWGIVWILKL